MSLKINKVQNASTPGGEYVVLVATEALNLKDYAVIDRTFGDDGKASNEHRHIFFFPNKAIAKDEYVVLYSGTGTNGNGTFTGGGEFHKFFWQSGKCIWNDKGGDTASVLKYSGVSTSTVAAV